MSWLRLLVGVQTTELQHESGVLAGLSHPNIVRFHGHGSIQWGPNTVVRPCACQGGGGGVA